MLKKCVAFQLLLIVLCAAFVQGMPTSRRQRCLCRGKRLFDQVNINHAAKVEFYQSSGSCNQEELVITLKRSGQTQCLDLRSQQGRIIKEAIMKKKK